jgi:hypothetical protein
MVEWNTASDWDNAVSEDIDIVHDTVGDRSDASQLELGYSSTENGLVSYWSLDGSGGTTTDNTGSNSLNDNNVSSDSNGIYSSSSKEYISSNNSFSRGSLSSTFTSDKVTLTAWVYPTKSGSNFQSFAKVATGGNGKNAVVFIQERNGNWDAVFRDNNNNNIVASTNVSINANRWYHLALVYDQSEIKIYVDGTLEGSTSSTAQINDFSDFAIGANVDRSSNQNIDAYIDEVRLYNTALSSSDITDLSNQKGSLTTSTKSFSTSKKPNIENLDYALNSQSIDLEIIGSPNTASEEIKTVSLGGSTSRTLSWTNSHTDFRIKASLSTTNVRKTPILRKVDLVASQKKLSASFSSLSSSSQTSTSIDVSADLDSISNSASSSVDLGFEFKESSNSTYQSQVTQTVDPSTISTPFNFSDSLSNLTSNTDHDIRAFADDGTNRVTSSNITVTTKQVQKTRLFGGLSSFSTPSDNRLFGDLKTFQSDGVKFSIGVDQIESDSARLKLFIDDIKNANKGRLFELYIDQDERRSFYTNLETDFKPIVGNLSPNTTFNYRVEEYKDNAFIKEKSLQFTTLPTQDLDVNVQFRFKAKFSGQQRSNFERNKIAFLEALKDGVSNNLDIGGGAIVDGSGSDLHTGTVKINNDNNKVKTKFAVLPNDLATNSNPQRYVIRDSAGNDIWSADISTEINTDTRQTILVTFISQ